MIVNALSNVMNSLHAQFCYQLFITPIYMPLPKEYRHFARLACQTLETERTSKTHYTTPRHHVIHHFSQPENPDAKKILITHGWMSRAAYMVRLIRALHKQGYQIYALDFPAHGEAKGLQLPWTDAVAVLRHILNHLGPFYAVIGHSFGGAMLLNTLNLANQDSAWQINNEPERVVLLASPTRMRTPVSRLARQLKLSKEGYLQLRSVFCQETILNLKQLNFLHYVSHAKTPFLCIHGKEDDAINPLESIVFCQHYPHASLSLLSGVDHINILFDERVPHAVGKFLA